MHDTSERTVNESLHTDPFYTNCFIERDNKKVQDLTFTKGENFTLKIYPKNQLNQAKKYHGDYFNIRVLKINRQKTRTISDEILYREPVYKMIQNNTYYETKIPCYKSGWFRLEVTFIRSAEIQEMIRRVMAGVRQKHRVWWCSFENGKRVSCGPGSIFLHEKQGKKVCWIDNTPGFEFYAVHWNQKSVSNEMKKCDSKLYGGGWSSA